MNWKKIVILIFGCGSNMGVLILVVMDLVYFVEIGLVLLNWLDVKGFEWVVEFGILIVVVDYIEFFGNCEVFEKVVDVVLKDYCIDFVVFVGFMCILMLFLVNVWFGCMINIYLVFLLVFKGFVIYEWVLEEGVKLYGVIVYYVLVEMDDGLIII